MYQKSTYIIELVSVSVVHCAPNKQAKQVVRIMHDASSVVIVNLKNFAHEGIMQVLWHIQPWLYI